MTLTFTKKEQALSSCSAAGLLANLRPYASPIAPSAAILQEQLLLFVEWLEGKPANGQCGYDDLNAVGYLGTDLLLAAYKQNADDSYTVNIIPFKVQRVAAQIAISNSIGLNTLETFGAGCENNAYDNFSVIAWQNQEGSSNEIVVSPSLRSYVGTDGSIVPQEMTVVNGVGPIVKGLTANANLPFGNDSSKLVARATFSNSNTAWYNPDPDASNAYQLESETVSYVITADLDSYDSAWKILMLSGFGRVAVDGTDVDGPGILLSITTGVTIASNNAAGNPSGFDNLLAPGVTALASELENRCRCVLYATSPANQFFNQNNSPSSFGANGIIGEDIDVLANDIEVSDLVAARVPYFYGFSVEPNSPSPTFAAYGVPFSII